VLAVAPTSEARQGRVLVQELSAELDRLRDDGLYRSRTVLDGAQGVRIVIDGRAYVSFASNDYLGLAADPRVIEAVRKAAVEYGVGAGASHLLYGHGRAHHALEEMLAECVGYPRALLFSSGYMANLGVVTALCGRDDEIFADRLNHASLNDAMVLSRARFRRYAHLDVDALERMLVASHARHKLVVTDGVFSMDGDIAPVPQLLAVCERHDAWLLLDDAHGFGVLGPHGAGTLSHFGIESDRVITMGTLGKAAGVCGAFVAAHGVVTDYLVNRARTYIYTTALPPMLAAALLESVHLLRAENHRRTHLRMLIETLVAELRAAPGRLLPSTTAIQPFVLGEAKAAVAASRRVAARGLLVPAVRPPTVPRGTARLRISLSAAHSVADVHALAAALRECSP